MPLFFPVGIPAVAADWQDRLETLPGLKALLKRRHARRFSSDSYYGQFRGVYRNFDEAVRSAPGTKPIGFSNEASAREFANRRTQIFSFDYPVLFWLAPFLRRPIRLFDYGGHCGTHFYAYAHYVEYSTALEWIVCELPEIIRVGERIAREQGKAQLSFTDRFERAEGADVLLAAGSLQYIESPAFSDRLETLKTLPAHILINKLPLYDGPTYVTLQNGSVAFHPMYVFRDKDFLDSICGLGYELVDRWEVPSHPGRIPFYPTNSFRCHTGLFFSRKDLGMSGGMVSEAGTREEGQDP
jgi:putative methyltransferase (TIGR04325 family)